MFDVGARGDWEVWRAAVIGGLLMIPFAVGANFGLRAILKRFSAGWVGFAANLVLRSTGDRDADPGSTH